jgi:regulator of nucleoside diphosphate kinase
MNAEQPEVVIARSQQKSLKKLIAGAFRQKHRLAPFLSAEVRRAAVCEDRVLPDDVVTLNREVSFRLDWGPASAYRTLVYPEAFVDETRQISLLSPIGVALLGLRPGDQMPVFIAPTGMHVLHVTGVRRGPSSTVRAAGHA